MFQPEKEVIFCDTDGVLIASDKSMTDAINNTLIHYFLHGKLLQDHSWITQDDWHSFEAPIEICEKYLGQTPDQIATWLFAAEIVCAGKAYPHAQQYLSAMASMGAQIHVVTSRAPDQRQATIDSVRAWYPFIPENRIHLRNDPTLPSREFKLKKAIELGATQYFDDDVSVIRLAEKLLPPWIAINMVEQPWNKNVSIFHKYLVTWEKLATQLQ